MSKSLTVKEQMLEGLTSKGLSDDEARIVFAASLERLEPKGYALSWDAPASDYPEPVYAVASVILDEMALAYIDQHCPKAWFRPMFSREVSL
jgi:hypothetical protein